MTGHVMYIASPGLSSLGRPHRGNWRALCTCGQLDGPERGTRAEAVADHEAHLTDVERQAA